MTQEFLNKNFILAMIQPEHRINLAQFELLNTIDSTNSYLLQQCKTGAASGSICFGEEQTAGRGRLGRTWFSPPGVNIYCSILWRFPQEIAGLSVAVAVMVMRALQKYGVSTGLQLKWPNDILFQQRKLAGILLERSGDAVVIGIGLNCDVASASEKKWTDLYEITGRVAERNKIAGLLINELLAGLPRFTADGLSVFMNEWHQHDLLFSKAITVHTPEKNISGISMGLNDAGELILEDTNGKFQTFCYGEVSVRLAMT